MKKIQLLIAFLMGCMALNAQITPNCLMCLPDNVVEDPMVQNTFKHFGLQKSEEASEDGFIQYKAAGILVYAEFYDGKTHVIDVTISPQFFEGQLPYGLDCRLPLSRNHLKVETLII
jgi:hypothetical protein